MYATPDPLSPLEKPIWFCPGCGLSWTEEQIEMVYYLNAIANYPDENPESGDTN